MTAALAGPDTNCVLPHPPTSYPGTWFETRNPTTVQNCGTDIELYSPVPYPICDPNTGYCGGYIWWANGLSGTPYDEHDFESVRAGGRILHIRFSRPLLKFVLRSQSTVYPNNRVVAYDSVFGGNIVGEFLLPVGSPSADSIVIQPVIAGKGGIQRIEITPDHAATPDSPSGLGEHLRMRVEFRPDTNCVTNDSLLNDMNVRRGMRDLYDASVAENMEKAGMVAEPDTGGGGRTVPSTDGLLPRSPKLPPGIPERSICHSTSALADPFAGDGLRYLAGIHTHIVPAGRWMANCPLAAGAASNGPSPWDKVAYGSATSDMYIVDPNRVWRKSPGKKAVWYPRRDKARQCTLL